MSLNLTAEMAQAEIDERVARAADYRRSHEVPAGRSGEEAFASVTVRTSYPDDHERLERLAERDGRRVPPNPVLIAEVSGRVLAARSLVDGSSISDPFEPTAHLIELLALRSAHLRDALEICDRRRFARLRRLIPIHS
jgi:hypothetical protein